MSGSGVKSLQDGYKSKHFLAFPYQDSFPTAIKSGMMKNFNHFTVRVLYLLDNHKW